MVNFVPRFSRRVGERTWERGWGSGLGSSHIIKAKASFPVDGCTSLGNAIACNKPPPPPLCGCLLVAYCRFEICLVCLLELEILVHLLRFNFILGLNFIFLCVWVW